MKNGYMKIKELIYDFNNEHPGLLWVILAGLILLTSFISPQFRDAVIKNFYSFVVTIIGIVLLKSELSAQRAIKEEQLKSYDKRLKFDEETHNKQQENFEEKNQKISNLSETLSLQIAKYLQTDSKWASSALEKAKIVSYGQTLFSDRFSHYQDEKKYIAKQFIPILLKRCQRIIQDKPNTHIYIVIDSGTTLYPLFTELGNELSKYARKNEIKEAEKWYKKITIVTNNLPGIQALMESGRLNPGDRYSELAVDAHILPGKPIPVYSAIAGKPTVDAIAKLSDSTSGIDSLFIGLLTGNFIRQERNNALCSIPLSRGIEHNEFKIAIYNKCNELYVIGPLGKIFYDQKLDDINKKLGFVVDSQNEETKSYVEIPELLREKKEVKLVTTCRHKGFVLTDLSDKLTNLLGTNDPNEEQFINAEKLKDIPHLFFPFSKLPENFFEQLEIEFPHPFITQEIKRNLFFVQYPRSSK